VNLPTQKTPPQVDLADQTILAYGPVKIGKSSFCARAEGALFLATEAGLNHLNVFQIPIRTWDDLLEACAELMKGKHTFKTIIVDTLDNAYRMCAEYICEKHGIKHESDLGYGKGFALVNTEFHRVLNKLSLLPYGLFLVSHSQEKEIEERTGKYTRYMPNLPDKARKTVAGMCDMVLYFDSEERTQDEGTVTHHRIIRTKPSRYYEAGDRTGKLPDIIDLDFDKFLAAYKIAVSDSSSRNSQPSTTQNRSNKK